MKIPQTRGNHQKILTFFEELKIVHHVILLKSPQLPKVVIGRLDRDTKIADINEALKSLNYPLLNVFQKISCETENEYPCSKFTRISIEATDPFLNYTNYFISGLSSRNIERSQKLYNASDIGIFSTQTLYPFG